ncbi:MAG: DUF1643 domain-containing protein, partial [Pseudomonadota bacterium]
AKAPIGDGNDEAVLLAATWAETTLCGWGVHGAHLDQGVKVAKMLRSAGHTLHHLGLTKAGHPRHPLYVSYDTQPFVWTQSSATD